MKSNNFDITKFHILYDNVLVKAIEIEEKGGIIKPSSYENKPELGKIISVGHGRYFENGEIVPLIVKVGQVVLYNKYSATKFNLDGYDYFIIREEDIIGWQ